MKYFNQNNYKNSPYNYPGGSGGTIAKQGCGVCCGANVLAFFGVQGYDPVTLADLFVKGGARVDGGTDMRKAAAIVAGLGHLTYTTTNSESELVEHLKQGGVAIANVDGDVGEKGIFSSAGHYVNVVGLDGNRPVVFDVGYYPGKFDSSYRKPLVYVTADKWYNTVQLCTTDTLNIDTKGRTPNYYLFKKMEDKPVTVNEALTVLHTQGVVTDVAYWTNAVNHVKNLDSLLIKMAEKLK